MTHLSELAARARRDTPGNGPGGNPTADREHAHHTSIRGCRTLMRLIARTFLLTTASILWLALVVSVCWWLGWGTNFDGGAR